MGFETQFPSGKSLPPAKHRRELQMPMMFVFRKHRPPWQSCSDFFRKNRWILHDQAQWVDSMRSIDLEPGLQYEEIPWCHWWMHNHFFVHEFSYQFLPIIFALQILTRKPLFGQETTESQRLGALLSSRKRLVKGIRKRALTRKQLLMGGEMVMSSHTQVMNGYSGSVHFQWQWNLLAKVQRSWTIFQVMMLLLNSSSP